MIDDAGHHEQRPLEQGMRHQVKHCGFDGVGQAEARQHDQKTERRHGRIGQHHLQVRLAHCQGGSGDERRHAEERQQNLPLRRTAEHRVEPHQKIDPRLHHRRRVQIGRNGRRRFHGVRQPEVKRKLCRLGECAAEDEEQRREIERALLQFVAEGQEQRKLRDAADVPQDEEPGEQGKPASPVTTRACKAARRAASRV